MFFRKLDFQKFTGIMVLFFLMFSNLVSAQFTNYQGYATTRGLTNATDQTVWANAGNGLLHYDLNGDLIEIISRTDNGNLETPTSMGTAITVAPNGDVWTASGYGPVRHYDGDTWTTFDSNNTPEIFQNSSINLIEAGPDGTIYAITFSDISVYRNGGWENFNLGVFSNGMSAAGFSPSGDLTLALGRGLATWTPEFGIQFIVGDEDSNAPAIYDFQYLENGDLYYSASGGEIYRIPNGSNNSILIATADEFFPRLAVESDGTIWVGTFAQGSNLVQRWTGNSWITYTQSNSTVTTSAVSDIIVDANDNIYVSQGFFTDDEGLQRFDGNNWELKYEGFIARGNSSLEQDFDTAGNLYTIGGRQLISKLNPTTGEINHFHRGNSPLGNNNVFLLSLTATGNNQIWAGTESHGIYHYDGNSWTQFTSANTNGQIPTNNIEAIKSAPDGTIYALARGFSPTTRWLVRYQPNTQTWTNYIEGAALPEDLNDLYVDAQGTAWVTSFNGLAKLENNTITTFTPDNSGISGLFSDYITGRPDGSEILFRGRDDNASSTEYFTFDGQSFEKMDGFDFFGGFNGGFSPAGDYFYGGDIFGSGGFVRFDGTDINRYDRNNSFILSSGGGGVISDPTSGVWYFNGVGVVRYTGDDNNPLTVDITSTDISCNNANDGTISVSISGGNPPYQLLFGEEIFTGNTFTFNNLEINLFSGIEVMDARGTTNGGIARIFNPSLINPNIIVSGNNITTNTSGGVSPYSYLWSNGSTGPNINNASQGSYTLTITDSNGCTVVGSASVNDIPNDYCESEGDQPWQNWIYTVFIGGINNQSGKSKYSDFTGQASTSLTTGTTREITLVAAWSYFTWDVYWRVWIDYNQNGIFEDTEIAAQTILNAPAPPGNPTPAFADISIPQSATLGSTRMRVSMKQGSFPEACEVFAVGEVEDYTVVIEEGTNGPICPLSGTTTNFTCDDNGTPNNPGDDLYYFDATITAATPNPNSQWLYFNNAYPYNVPVNLGPFPIAGGDESLFIRDINSTNANSCELFLFVDLPIGPCSNGTPPPTDDCENNLLTNPGFENDLTDWQIAGTANTTSSNTRTGNGAAELGNGSSRIFRKFDTSVDNTFTLKTYLRSGNGDKNAGISIKYMSSSFQPILNETDYFTVGSTYTLFEKTETAPANTAFIEISIRGFGDGNLLADDICLTNGEVTPPTNEPDLQVDFGSGNYSADPGAVASFNFDLTNAGTAIVSDSYRVGFVLSTDATLSSNDVFVGEVPTGNTGIGTTADIGGAITVPSNLAAGNYFLIAKADFDDIITESNENNNTATRAFTVNGSTPPTDLPDLQVAFGSGNYSGNPGAVASFNFDLINAGTVTATESYQIGFVLSTNATLSSDDVFVGEVPTGDTGVGTIFDVGGAITIPGNLAAGNYFLIAKADFDEVVTESNENNNLATQAFTVNGTVTPPTGDPNCEAESDFPWHEWASEVTVNGTTKSSSKSTYSDFTSTMMSFGKIGNNEISLTAEYSYVTEDAYWRVWIDYNQNDIYEADEIFYEAMVPAPASGSGVTSSTQANNLSIPSSALNGATKMRVIVARDAFAEPCGIVPFGEVEDYTAVIGTSSATTQSNGEDASFTDSQLISLAPNPATNHVVIGLDKMQGKPFEMMITNQLGQVILHQSFAEDASRRFTYDTSGLPTGIYFIWLNAEGKRSIPQKLIKQKL